MSVPRLQIRLLGPVDVRLDGKPIAVDTRKAVALLAYLAVTDRPASRASLAALLWPNNDEEGARGALRRTLSVLRAASGRAVLRVDRNAVAIEPGGATVDVSQFREHLGRGRAHDHGTGGDTCPECLEALTAAVALDRGEFMAGFSLRDSETFDEWQRAQADAHRRDLGGALERLTRARFGAGDVHGALAAGRRWLELDPLHEPAHRLLIVTCARIGEVSAAIQQYRDCVAILNRELGVTPLPETTELYEAVRDGRFEPVPPTSTAAVSERAARAPADRPRELPLVGRADEMERALAVCDGTTDSHIVALVGEAGIGKTRLGDEIIARVLSHGGRVLSARAYAGEENIAWAMVLTLLRSGLTDPAAADRLGALPEYVRAALERLDPSLVPGARRSPSIGGGETIAARLSLLEAVLLAVDALTAGDGWPLLWLDGIESADASSLEAVAYLIRRLAGRRLTIMMAWRQEDVGDRVAPLVELVEQTPSATLVLLDRLDYEAVRKLVRATGADHDAGFDAALFAGSEGLPLYVNEVLASGVSPGHGLPSGMRALIRERIGSIDGAAKQLLTAAAVIGRSFDLATVRRASGRSDDETVEGLDQLARRGLVREIAGERWEIRYEFSHGAFRDAAYEATSLARRRLLHRRVADAVREAPATSPAEALGHLALIAAHERAAGNDATASLAFAEAGHLARKLAAPRDAVAHFESALAMGHPEAAAIQLALGEVSVLLGEYRRAFEAFETAAALAAKADLPAVELRLGRAHALRGDLGAAASHLDAALGRAETAGAPDDLQARILLERGFVAFRSGRMDDAEAFATDALDLAERTDDPAARAAAERLVGVIATAVGDLPRARDTLRRSLDLSLGVVDPEAGIAARNALALAEAAAGNRPAAVALLEAALEVSQKAGSRHLQAAIENNLADVLHAAGDPEASMAHLKRAVALFADVGGTPGLLDPDVWRLAVW